MVEKEIEGETARGDIEHEATSVLLARHPCVRFLRDVADRTVMGKAHGLPRCIPDGSDGKYQQRKSMEVALVHEVAAAGEKSLLV